MTSASRTFRIERLFFRPGRWMLAEAAGVGLLQLACLHLCFHLLVGGGPAGAPLLAGGLFFAVWLGLRFRLRGALGAVAVAFVAVLYAAVRDGGFFPSLPLAGQLGSALAMIGLPGLAAVVVALALVDARDLQVGAESRSQLLRKIFNSLPIGVWVRAPSGRTVLVNDRWAQFCGLGGKPLEGGGVIEARLGLGEDWESAVRTLIERSDAGVDARRIDLSGGEGPALSFTLLTVGLFVDEIGEYGTLSLLIDETDLQAYKRRTRESEERLQSALDSAGMGFWEMDVPGQKVYRDRNWFLILGMDEDAGEDDPKAWLEQVHPDDRERVRQSFERMLGGRQLLDIEYRVRRASGSYIWVQDRARVVGVDGAGKAVRVMGIMLEVSQRKRWEIDLVRAKERADAANEAKGNFIATISHEIRTPLNAIIGLSSFLVEGELDEEQMEHARMINSSGRSLLLLVNDILDFSRIESGRLELEVQDFPLKLCCEDCIKLFSAQAREKGLHLSLDLEEGLPEYVSGDMERLRQVLQNLLSNAIKFTESGEVELSVRSTDISRLPSERCPDPLEPLGYLDDPEHGYLEIQVRDTGVGIPQDRQRGLFEAFSQADASTTRRYGGTGLGLAICKRLVQAMGGRIWLESQPGQGTLVAFNLRVGQLYRGESEEPKFTRSPFEEVTRIADEHPCDMLIVGEKDATERLFHSCRKLGYAPHHAPGYDLSSDAFRRRRYNLIFIWMGDEARGLELARQLSVDRTRTRPQSIIGVVPEGREISRERCVLSGIRELITVKPRPAVVREAILGVLSAPD